ncbi:MAG: DUF6036 family nucleotidyltransferase [Candidatus Paceibacterota bacterium]
MSKGFGINNVLQLAAELSERLDELQLPYCLIGGVAFQRWGEPRQTVDVDATVFVGFGNERRVVQKLTALFTARIENAPAFAIENRILLLESADGLGIDLSLGGMPYEQRMVDRASFWIVPEHGRIRTCSAEDLVVLKAFASRPQDWIDVEKVIIRQGEKLDRELIIEELTPLVELKEEPEILSHLNALFEKTP